MHAEENNKSSLRDTLVKAIKAPGNSRFSFKAGLVLLPVNLSFFLLSFSTSNWLESSIGYDVGGITYTSRSQGLWRYCQTLSGVECCGYINEVIGLHSQSVPAFVNAVRSFMVIGLIFQMVCLTRLFYIVFYDNVKQDFYKAEPCMTLIVSCMTTAISVLLSIVIYGGAFSYFTWTKEYTLSWSYGFAVISGIIYLIEAIVFIIDRFSD